MESKTPELTRELSDILSRHNLLRIWLFKIRVNITFDRVSLYVKSV